MRWPTRITAPRISGPLRCPYDSSRHNRARPVTAPSSTFASMPPTSRSPSPSACIAFCKCCGQRSEMRSSRSAHRSASAFSVSMRKQASIHRTASAACPASRQPSVRTAPLESREIPPRLVSAACELDRPANTGTIGRPSTARCRDSSVLPSLGSRFWISSTIRQTGRAQSAGGNMRRRSERPASGGAVAVACVPLPLSGPTPTVADRPRVTVWRNCCALSGSSSSAMASTRAAGSSSVGRSTNNGCGSPSPACAHFSWRCVSRAVLPAPGAPWNRRVAPASAFPSRKRRKASAQVSSISSISADRPTKNHAALRSRSATNSRSLSRSGPRSCPVFVVISVKPAIRRVVSCPGNLATAGRRASRAAHTAAPAVLSASISSAP